MSAGAFQTVLRGGEDSVVVKLGPPGTSIFGIAVDVDSSVAGSQRVGPA